MCTLNTLLQSEKKRLRKLKVGSGGGGGGGGQCYSTPTTVSDYWIPLASLLSPDNISSQVLLGKSAVLNKNI